MTGWSPEWTAVVSEAGDPQKVLSLLCLQKESLWACALMLSASPLPSGSTAEREGQDRQTLPATQFLPSVGPSGHGPIEPSTVTSMLNDSVLPTWSPLAACGY